MAVVKMGQIKSTPAKAIAYIVRPDATSDGLWVSTNAAVLDPSDHRAIARQFAATAERVGVAKARVGGVLAHHVIQSFAPTDAVSAEQAHRIGVQLAERITDGTHEYVIATHLDKGHVHNHIIFNATNLEHGRKFRVVKSTIGSIRDVNDELCVAAGLEILPKPERATGRSMGDIYRVLKGESAKEFLRTEIDKAAAAATTWDEFQATLARRGIETTVRGSGQGTVAFREITMGRAVRDWRLGQAYTEASIMARLAKQAVHPIGVDVSMVISESREALTVVVPGTGRELHLTVAKRQVVRHGRTLRMYVPAAGEQLLSDRRGQLARTVPTTGLYEWFSQPDLARATQGAKAKHVDAGHLQGWSPTVRELRSLEARINAKARWMHDGGDAGEALDAARARLGERYEAYQTAMVAAAEVMADPAGDVHELRVLQAQARQVERELGKLSADVTALTQLTGEETSMMLSETIAARTAGPVDATRQVRESPSRAAPGDGDQPATSIAARLEQIAARRAGERDVDDARRDLANDRETPATVEHREAEETAQQLRHEDQANDRRPAARELEEDASLADRLEQLAARRAADRERRDDDGTPRQRPNGRNR